MGVNVIKKRLSDFRSEESLRYDYKYITSLVTSSKDFYTYRNLFDFVPYEKVDISELDKFKYAEIGNVNKLGEVEPVVLSFDDRQEENESLFKKIEKGDIINPKKNDILISKIRPYLNKNVLVNSDDEYFTKAFIQIRPKINSELLHIAIRNKFITLLNAVSRQGKGYPTLKEDDIKAIRFPKTFVDALTKNEDALIKNIQPIRSEISGLKLTQKTTLDILNQVFSEKFGFVWATVERLQTNKYHTARFLHFANDELKFDYSLKTRFIFNNYIKSIENLNWISLNKVVDVKGGKRLPKGQNVLEDETEFKYVRVEDLNWDGSFDLESIKYITEKNHLAIKNYIANENDILLTIVGATVGKCGLFPAELDGENITENFARLIIKDKESYLPEYVNYCLMSKSSQIQFDEYTGKSSQGKLAIFRIKKVLIPELKLDQQAEIVETIKTQLDAQKEIDRQIEEKQQAINKIIEDAIRKEQANA